MVLMVWGWILGGDHWGMFWGSIGDGFGINVWPFGDDFGWFLIVFRLIFESDFDTNIVRKTFFVGPSEGRTAYLPGPMSRGLWPR